MKELAVFGIVMLVIISLVLQHLAHYFASKDIRSGLTNNGNTALFGVCLAVSIFLLWVAFHNAVTLF